MSSKKLAYLLTVLIVCGFIATGTAQGQTFGTVLISGTITNPDGTPAVGLEVRAEIVPFNPDALESLTFTSRNDGTFSIASTRGAAKITVGDIIKLTVTNASSDVVGEVRLTIADDANTTFAGNAVIIKGIDIQLRESGIDVDLDPAALYANGTDEATITVTVLDDGTGVTGDTITISASKGTVGVVTEVGNGVYTATYTAPLLDLTIPDILNITVRSATTGLNKTYQTVLLPVPTTVTVEVVPSSFIADTTGTGTVTVTVKRAVPVTGENIELVLSPEIGSVSAVTDNGDGTYTATYTSGGTAEEVTLTATATPANKSDEATIFINAGPPAEIVLSANPTTVTSLGRSTIIAMVSDASDNPVGGLTLTGDTSGDGEISEFASTAFGTYTATYSAPEVDAEGTETITVSTAGISADLMLDLTPEPPIDVSLIVIEGTVYKEDGEVPANDVTVAVTVGSNAPKTRTTDADGSYSVAFVGLGTAAATTGDLVSVVVADANVVALDVNGIEQSGSQFPLVNDILEKVEAGESVTVNVTTDIVIPPRSVNLLTVEGTVYTEDGEVPANDVTVTVTVGSNPPDMDMTDMDGSYSAAFVGLGAAVATTGDLVFVVVAGANVVALDVNGVVHSGSQFPLVDGILEKVEAGESVIVNVTTDIVIPPRSVNFLTVEGMVFKEGGEDSAGGGLDVMVTVGSQAPQMDTTDTNGSYSVAFVGLGSPVATSEDNMLSVVVSDGSGPRGRNDDPLSNTDLDTTGSATVERNVETNIKLTSNLLVVEGTVFLLNGDTPVPATSDLRESDLTVVVTNTTRKLTESVSVKDDGTYGVVFQALGGAAVAETGDELTIEAQNEARETVGSESPTLDVANLQAARVEKDIHTTVRAVVNTLRVIGDVTELDGSPAGGVQVTLTLVMDGNAMAPEMRTTDAAGGYQHFFLKLGTPLAATGDTLIVEARREFDQFVGYEAVDLRSAELAGRRITVDSIVLSPSRLKLGGLSINPYPMYRTLFGEGDPTVGNLMGLLPFDLTQPGALQGLGGLDLSILPTDPSLENLIGMLPSGLTQASGLQELAGTGASIPPSLLAPTLVLVGMIAAIALPPEFGQTDEHIDPENFGNAVTPRPMWYPFARDIDKQPGRWVNGDQLNLYISGAPTIKSVTFTLNGLDAGPVISVPAGETFPYTFQLEEELIALFSGGMPTFDKVWLMIDGQAPIKMMLSDARVWSVDVMLVPGSPVSYYYVVELTQPYIDSLLIQEPIHTFPLPDPRNLQLEVTDESALKTLLEGGVGLLSTMDPGIRSVFNVPVVDYQRSLWVKTLTDLRDDEYTLEVDVSYHGGYKEPEPITAMFTVDKTPPTADVAVGPGVNSGMYPHPTEEGVYIATGLMPGAALNVSAIPGATAEAAGYMFQFALLDAAGNPGTWNPAITMDLPSLPTIIGTLRTLMPALSNLVSNPEAAVLLIGNLIDEIEATLPLALGPPHRIPMLIRSSDDGVLLGRYGLRAVGIDSLLNMDSGRGPGVVVDLVPPDPDIAMVSSVAADFDGNGVIEGPEIQSTAGDVVVFSGSIVTLTVDVVERTVHPLMSIAIEVEMPGVGSQPVAMFSGDQLAATMLGDQFMVTLPVLPDRGAHVILRTVTTNALNVVHTREVSVAYERRTPPEVSAIHAYVTDRHPDSGAAQGLITVSAFTQAMTSPDAAAVQLEIRRAADADWMPIGIVQIANTKVTSHVQIAIIEDLVNSIVSGAPTAPLSLLYREWPLTIDSATLEDTIMDDSPAASDASLDDNPYVLRAIAVDTAAARYESADGVTDSFSTDNYSSTAITQVANEVEMVAAREDGSYYVSGLIAEDVPDPMLTLTSWTGAHPNAFTGGLKLAINDASGTAVEIAETAFSAAGNHNYTAAFNLGSIPNGVYTVMAVGHTADGAPEERIVAMAITVEVGNFTPPDNFADPTVDILSVTNTRGEANSPSDTDAMYPIGLPAVGDEVCATLIVPNVSAGDVDVLIGEDLMSAAMMGAITVMDPDANNNILVCIDTSGLDEGMYSLVGVVSKPNGSVQFGLPSIRVDRTAPVIEIVSPLEGHQVSSLPAVQVTYSDDTGFDPQKTDPRAVTVTLTRLASNKTVNTNPEMIRSVSAAGEVLTQTGSIVYTHDDPLAGGAYRIDISVTDTLGNTATAEPVEFTSEGVAATVSIITPSAGQVVDPDQPLIISAAFTGIGEITVDQLLINGGTYKPQSVKDNLLTHTIQPPFGVLFKRGSGNRISIKIVDEEGNTAEATTNFAVAKDTIPPVVATYSPLGIIRTDRPIAAATVTDASGIKTSSLTIIIAGVPGNQGTGRRSSPTSTTVTFTPSIAVTPGPYTARVTVEDVHGNRTEAEWQFTVELDVTPPAITTNSPQGVIRTDKPIISVSASDDMSGVDTIEIGVKGEGNQAVEGVTSVRSDKTSATFTPAASLTSGTYTVNVKLADVAGNKASGQWQFTVELDTIPPAITITRPMQEHTENRRPIISASYTDNLSGVDAESIKLSLDGAAIEPDAVSETQVMFTPTFDLTFGQHTVKLEVSDMAPSANTAVQEWSFFVERMGIANARNYPNPFDGETTIALRISRQASITVQIYDFTGRLVAEPLTNSVREAGPVEIKWDGQTSAGDSLARGVYFCHILMESELEPQSAILKMAVISE